LSANLPDLSANLPDLSANLPDLSANLPDLSANNSTLANNIFSSIGQFFKSDVSNATVSTDVSNATVSTDVSNATVSIFSRIGEFFTPTTDISSSNQTPDVSGQTPDLSSNSIFSSIVNPPTVTQNVSVQQEPDTKEEEPQQVPPGTQNELSPSENDITENNQPNSEIAKEPALSRDFLSRMGTPGFPGKEPVITEEEKEEDTLLTESPCIYFQEFTRDEVRVAFWCIKSEDDYIEI
jgi:hypothetical protein